MPNYSSKPQHLGRVDITHKVAAREDDKQHVKPQRQSAACVQARGQDHDALRKVLVEGPNAGGRAGVAHRGHFRMGTFESGPECFTKNHIWRSKRAGSALEFLGPFIQCRMLVEGEVLVLDSRHYYVVNRGRLKIPAHGGEVSTILTTGGSFGEAGLLGPPPESEKQNSSSAREILTLARRSHIHQSLTIPSHRRSPPSTAVQLEEARAMEWCDVRFVELSICRDVLRVHSRFRDDLRELLEHPTREVPPPFDDGINSKKQSKKPARQPWGYGLPAKRGSVVQQPSKWSIRRPQSSMSEEIKAWAADESLKQRKAAAMRLGNHSPGGGLWSGRECLRQAMHTYRSLSTKRPPPRPTSSGSGKSHRDGGTPVDVFDRLVNRFDRRPASSDRRCETTKTNPECHPGRRQEKRAMQTPRDSTIAVCVLRTLYGRVSKRAIADGVIEGVRTAWV
ncbi:hypothetical protein FOZ61_001938 [Perkinsus olseni]|uniref:Cyclic nucleotide-binding domain-containing protein n=1 Tax=Perkinsus olseni TaxID=32597 RepID=A0A7J6LV87_PEROL|nr:hypothetical protein FOZ61_001938 [Perkinsus olseni]